MGDKSNKGFTLIEVIISIAILMIVGAFLLDSLTFTVSSNAASKNITIASNLAQEEMERIKSTLLWNEIADIPEKEVDGYPAYKRSVEVDGNYATNPPLKKVSVFVKWENRQVELTTLLAQYDRNN